MKNFSIKSIVAAAAFVVAGTASAAVITVPTDGTTVTMGVTATGAGALSFSADLLGALDTGKVSVAGYGAATATVIQDVDGYYVEASASAPMTSLQIDTVTGQVLSAATTGGATQTSPVMKSVSSGCSLTVTDLNVDTANKKVYATIIGGNGVGTLNNFYLWDAAAVTGDTTFAGPGTYNTQMTGLSITTAGFDVFIQSLGLLKLGRGALLTVTDFGVINSTIVATAVPAVPEPATYAYLLGGLAVVGMGLRRRAK